ncbi:hypothetical protein NDU88_000701 [Pleurodeles waltl]|uniref:Uncharacterized protein n=1 Tax=Pleurodeles waltl TaxID=8319 RepID=A0AAV7VX00_PLEWA|nr:hypothetical protein NDU88_000701 [Pleurodeles waltl]
MSSLSLCGNIASFSNPNDEESFGNIVTGQFNTEKQSYNEAVPRLNSTACGDKRDKQRNVQPVDDTILPPMYEDTFQQLLDTSEASLLV